jgi:hypothetical protein
MQCGACAGITIPLPNHSKYVFSLMITSAAPSIIWIKVPKGEVSVGLKSAVKVCVFNRKYVIQLCQKVT